MKPHKRYKVAFHRQPTADEIEARGPLPVLMFGYYEAPTKALAQQQAEAEANQHGWQIQAINQVTTCTQCDTEIIWFIPPKPGPCPRCEWWDVPEGVLARQIVANLGWRWLFARRMHRDAQRVQAEGGPEAVGDENLAWLEMSTHAQAAEAWNAFQSAMSMLYGQGG